VAVNAVCRCSGAIDGRWRMVFSTSTINSMALDAASCATWWPQRWPFQVIPSQNAPGRCPEHASELGSGQHCQPMVWEASAPLINATRCELSVSTLSQARDYVGQC